MPKSKKRLKKNGRRQPTKRRKPPTAVDKGWDGRGGYTKTDGESNLCYYDRNHNLQKIEPSKPSELPTLKVLSLDYVWRVGTTVGGKTVKEIIDWHPRYLEYWLGQLELSLDEEATAYLITKKMTK